MAMADSLVTRCPLILHPRGAIGQQARGVDLRRHVGQLVLDGLKLRDGPAELLALLGILQRRFVSALRGADRERRDRNAPAVQNPQAVDESFALLAAAVAIRAAGNR